MEEEYDEGKEDLEREKEDEIKKRDRGRKGWGKRRRS